MAIVTVTIPKCGECGKPITSPNAGRIIIGDVYNARLDSAGTPMEPLVGPSFPTPPAKTRAPGSNPDDWDVNFGHIRKHCFCMDCLLQKLEIPVQPANAMRDIFGSNAVTLNPSQELADANGKELRRKRGIGEMEMSDDQ